MNSKLKWVALAASVFGMGLSMPSCPGQQAVQQQVDKLQAENQEIKAKVSQMENVVNGMKANMEKMEPLVVQMGSTIQEQKLAMDRMNAALTTLQEAPKSAPAKGGKKAAAPKKKKG
jgi:peptidoglycan hydrolase CwlO-like protein